MGWLGGAGAAGPAPEPEASPMLTPPELTLMPPGGAAGGIPLPPGVPGGRGVSICGAGAVPPSMTPERQAKP